jgi:hypothetical protein
VKAPGGPKGTAGNMAYRMPASTSEQNSLRLAVSVLASAPTKTGKPPSLTDLARNVSVVYNNMEGASHLVDGLLDFFKRAHIQQAQADVRGGTTSVVRGVSVIVISLFARLFAFLYSPATTHSQTVHKLQVALRLLCRLGCLTVSLGVPSRCFRLPSLACIALFPGLHPGCKALCGPCCWMTFSLVTSGSRTPFCSVFCVR